MGIAVALCWLVASCSGDQDSVAHDADGGDASAPPAQPGSVAPPDGIWVRSIESVGDESMTSISPRDDGSFVVLGGYEGPATFSPGQPDEQVLALPDAEHEAVLAHYELDGSLRELRVDPLGTGAGRVLLRRDGSLYVTGGGAFTSGSVMVADDADVYVGKYDADGRALWASSASGESGTAVSSALVAWDDGSVAIGGTIEGTVEFGAGEPNQTRLASNGEEIFLARYDGSGVLQWAKRAIAAPYLPSWRLEAAADGGLFIYGSLENVTTFNPDVGDETQLQGGNIGFLVKLDAAGELLWAWSLAQDTGMNGINDVAPHADGGASVVGSFDRIFTLGAGERGQTVLAAVGSDFPGRTQFPDFFAARFDAQGKLSWARREGGEVWDGGAQVEVLDDDATLLAGTYTNSVTFAEGEPAQATLTTDSNETLPFMMVVEPDGAPRWVRQGLAGPIAPLADGSLAIAGTFMGTRTLFAGEPGETTLASAGGWDAYVARFAF